MVQLDYTVASNKSISEAIKSLEAALAQRNFGILWHLHVNDKLREKGFDLEPDFHILEVCNPAKAKGALEMDLKIGYLLPCKIVVYQDHRDGNQTKIGLLRPEALVRILNDERFAQLAHKVEQELRAAVNLAAQD